MYCFKPMMRSCGLRVGCLGNQVTCSMSSFWKFNASLIDEEMYVSLIRDKYSTWIEEGSEIEDPRVLWDYVKYKIRQETIVYSKSKARERRATLTSLERKIEDCQIACDKDPSSKNLNDLEILQTDYDRV